MTRITSLNAARILAATAITALLSLPTFAGITPSIGAAGAFPAAPAFKTFDPNVVGTDAERTITGTRNMPQTFQLASDITIDKIDLLFDGGVTGALARIQIFSVADTNAASILTDYNNAVTNGFLLDQTFNIPTVTYDRATFQTLTLDLTGADEITLAATSGTAGYGMTFLSPDGVEVFTWRSKTVSSHGPYAGGRFYNDTPAGANGSPTRDYAFALEAVAVAAVPTPAALPAGLALMSMMTLRRRR
ncbi:MAG: hypothetical protein GC162_02455 [Planctomycetes bacterium]|nr:hypothetical protein [Planctomycetota bacterium]